MSLGLTGGKKAETGGKLGLCCEPRSRTWTRDFKCTASQKSRHIKHFAWMHRNCAAVGMVHLSGEDFPILD
jgi:hypothetical protein